MEETLANRYRVVSELGRGGMGTVYRVQDPQRENQEVALKVIQAQETISQDLRLRFKEEFRAMVKLKHPNTIEVFDYGQIDAQTQYLTMEIVPGAELTELIRGGALPLDQVYQLLLQLLQALGFIHARLYVHRDIKAENIRVREDGTLKLMDFGLMDQLGNPSSGKITGTPGYLPPEVPKGGVINASSDLYSVGCLAYELLSGRLPFRGSVIEVIRAHMDQMPPDLRNHRQDLPERLIEIVMKLLEKDQKLRYQQASEVIADLADLAGMRVTVENIEQKKSYLTSSVLVGRDNELAELEKAFDEARGGRARSVFVGAPAGIGKSRLVQELLLHAKLNDVPVLHGQCLESGMAPYEPLVQVLRSMLPLSSDEEVARYGPALARLLPELGARGVQELAPLDPTEEKIRVDENIVNWVLAVSERTPLVVFFDDLHWADSQSLDTYNNLVRQGGKHRVLSVATFRNDEAPPSSPIWFTIDENYTRYLKLGAFNLAQVMLLLQAMLRDVTISKEFSQFLYDSTAGNAFFLTEVMRYLIEEGVLTRRDGTWHFPVDIGGLEIPNSVEATVLRRLSQLSDEAVQLARVASVLGRYQEREMLLAVSQLGEDDLFARLDELIERQFLVKDSDQRYTFPHDRVREALYDGMEEQARREIHERCGLYIERTFPERRQAMINELAYHFYNGQDGMKGYRYMREAGDLASNSGQNGMALENWKRAEEVLGRIDFAEKEVHQVDLWFQIASRCFEIWPTLAVDALDKLIPVLEAQGNIDGICALLKNVVGLIKKLPPAARDKIIGEMTKPVAYQHTIRSGLAKLMPPPPPPWVQRMVECYVFRCAAYGFGGQPTKGIEAIERAEKLLPFTDTPIHGALMTARCVSLMSAGRFDEMLAILKRVKPLLIDRDVTGQPPAVLAARVGYSDFVNACAFQGVRPSDEVRDLGLRNAEAIQQFSFKNITWSRHAIYLAWTGRLAEAAEYLEMMTQNSRKIGAPPHHWAIYLRPYLAWQRGNFEEASALIQQALRYPHIDRDILAEQCIYLLKGQIHLGLGEFDKAREDFEAAEKRGRWGNMFLVTMMALAYRAELALVEQKHEEAKTCAEECLKMAAGGASRNPLFQAIAERLLARLALATGKLDEVEGHLKKAMGIVSAPEQDNLLEQGHLRALEGEWQLARGNQDAAREAFRGAAAIFHGLANRHLLRPVNQRLEALRKPEAGAAALEYVLPDEQRDTRLSMLLSQWNETFLPTSVTIANEQDFQQYALETALSSLGADEVTLLRHNAGWAWEASRNPSGPCSECRTNAAFLAQVQAEKSGLVTVDLPDEMAIGVASNLEAEIPSVAVAPIILNGQVVAALYAVRRDLSRPFEQEDLEILQKLCEVLGKTLSERQARASVLSSRAGVTHLAEELRSSFHKLSLNEQSQHDLLPVMLKEYATKLSLDEVTLVVEIAGEERTMRYPETSAGLNAELISRVRASRTPVVAIEMPEELGSGSNLGGDVSSVAIVPLAGAADLVYCVRKGLDSPLNEDDLPLFDSCAKVLGEVLQQLHG